MLAVQKALLAALAGLTVPNDTTGGAAVAVPAYDAVPANAGFPFVVVRDHQVTPDDTYDTETGRHTVELTVHSQYRGHRQLIGALAAIKVRLHQVALTLEDGVCVACRVASVTTSRDPDGLTVLGSVEIDLLVETPDT